MDKIEKNAHVLGKLAKSYSKIMYGDSAHWMVVDEAKTYSALRKEQTNLIKALQEENTP